MIGGWRTAYFCAACDERLTNRQRRKSKQCAHCGHDTSYSQPFRIHRRPHWWQFWKLAGTEWGQSAALQDHGVLEGKGNDESTEDSG